jgi:hypothetical protein
MELARCGGLIMLVDLTPQVIEDGERRSCDLCPLALRLQQLTSIPWSVHPDYVVPRVARFSTAHRVPLPEVARNWIYLFDTCVPRGSVPAPPPISFELFIEDMLALVASPDTTQELPK